MKVNKKTIATASAIVGIVALAAGGTIAYFTDNDTKTNSFTVGNVDITLYESQLHRVNANVKPQFSESSFASPVNPDNYNNCLNGNAYCTPNIAVSTDLSGVSAWQNGHVRAQNVAGVTGAGQAGVFSDAQIIADAALDGTAVAATATNPGNYKGYVAAEYNNLVPGKSVRKFVYIKNTGTSSAYARVKVTIPESVKNLVTVKVPHTPTETSTPTGNTNINGVEMGAYLTASDATDDTNGNRILTFIYTSPLKPGEMTYWSPITTVTINSNVKESDFDDAALETFRETGFGIIVDADAIQSDGFDSAATAFAEFDSNSSYENEVNE